MKKQKLYMVKADEDSDWTLGLEDDAGDALESRPAKESECTLEAMAEMLDQDAENENQHSFVGTHERLGSLVEKACGRKNATAVMRRLVDAGGLQNMDV